MRCHSHHCSYQSIAEGFGIELPSRRQGRSNDRWLIAVYDHPDGVPRKVYRRDWPRDFPEAPAICVYKSQGEVCNKTNPHKHIWGAGSSKGAHLLLWGEDLPGNALLVAEGEKDAGALLSAGVNAQGYTPVSWRGGAGKEKIVGWSRAAGRAVTFWPDNHDQGVDAMEAAAEKAEQAGAAPLQMVDLAAIAHLPEGGGAADLPAAEVLAVILTATDFTPPPPPPAAPAMEEATGRQPIQVKFKTLDEYLIPMANGATDMRMAVRFLRDHGADMVGAYYPTPAKGAQPPSDLYHVKETGLLESSDGLIGERLAKSAARYQADLNDMNRQTAGEAKVMFGYVRTLQSHAAIGKVRAMLDSAHRNISAKGFNLGGYLHVKADAVNSDLRVLGAPNGVIDLENGKLLSRKSAAAKLIPS